MTRNAFHEDVRHCSGPPQQTKPSGRQGLELLAQRALLSQTPGGDMDATFLTAQTVLTTSGRWRAGDTIVRDVGWLFDHGQPALTVVTSDKLLRKRCRAARVASDQRVRFEASEAFAGWLPAWQDAHETTAEPPDLAPAPIHPRLREFVEFARQRPRPSTATRERTAGCSVRGRKT